MIVISLLQFKFKEVPLVEIPEDAGCWKKFSLRIYNLIFTLMQPLFVVNGSLDEMGNDITADQIAAETDKAIESVYQVRSVRFSMVVVVHRPALGRCLTHHHPLVRSKSTPQERGGG